MYISAAPKCRVVIVDGQLSTFLHLFVLFSLQKPLGRQAPLRSPTPRQTRSVCPGCPRPSPAGLKSSATSSRRRTAPASTGAKWPSWTGTRRPASSPGSRAAGSISSGSWRRIEWALELPVSPLSGSKQRRQLVRHVTGLYLVFQI